MPFKLCVLFLLGGFLVVPTFPAAAQPRPAPLVATPLAKRMHGEEALQTLGSRVREVAEFHRMKEGELRELFQRDKSLWVDPDGRLLYVCEFQTPQEGLVGESTNTPPINPLYALDQTFKLHSRPGASRTIYLDFDGHDASTTIWDGGGGTAPIARPYDTDGNPYTFSTTERTSIQYIWARVAEHYLQYDLDVTTEDPGVDALKNTGTGRYGVRVAIGGDSTDWYNSSGGVAYLNSFDDNIDLPCWVFPKSLSDNEKYIADAAAHEAGHTLGLSHDGRTSPSEEYYEGQGNWAPIMGVGYNHPIVQWSKGEYTNPSNTEDDLTRMLSFGAIYRADDYGDNTAAAFPLTGVKPFVWGIISTRTDVDFFSFEAGAGTTSITASPAPRGPSLHILLSLYNSAGNLITSAEVADSSSAGTLPVTISQNLPAGKYYVSVDGIGVGNVLTTGYTDYASLGQYTLAVTLPGNAVWAATAGGAPVWTNVANWSSSTTPFGLSAVARLNNNIAGDQNILIDMPVKIGGLLLGDSDATHAFTIAASGAGVLQLGVTNGSAWIGKTTGANDTISAPMELLSGLAITNTALSDLTLAGDLNGAFTLTKFGTGRLVLAGVNEVTGGLAINEGTVALADTATVADVGAITVGSGATLDVSAYAGGWLLAPNQTLAGYGVVTGVVTTIAGSHLMPGTALAAGTLTFADDLILTNGTILDFNLTAVTNVGGADNDLIAVAGDLILDGTITVDFNHDLALPETNGTYTILTYGGTLVGSAANLVAANAGNRFGYALDDSVPGEIRVQISGAPEALVWQGDGSTNIWDVSATANWLRGGSPDAFFQGDSVLFDATGSASPAINLSAMLSPTILTVSNVAAYTFSGSGRISGAATLVKQGSAALTLSTSNDFSGPTIIQGGTVNVGNAAALGLTNAGTIVTNGGQLNVNGTTIGFEPVTLAGAGPSGAGALVNTGATQTNAIRQLTLAGDTTIGGTARWDVRGIPASNITATLTGNGFALTKTGVNQVWLANLGGFDLGNITVNQGTLGFEGVNALTAGSSTLTVNSGATLAFLNSFDSDFTRSLVLNSATLQNDSGHSILTGGIALSGTTTTPVGEAATLDLRGTITGSGNIAKTGVGILRLAGANSFTGNVTVSAGTLMAGGNTVLGDTNGTTTIASGARLDVSAFNLGAEQVYVAGNGINTRGAIINSLPTAQANALRFVTLTGDTTFGGNGRWDIRANPTGALLGAFNLSKVSDNDIWLVNLGDTEMRNITINEGTVGFQGTTTMGNPANTITVNSGGSLGIYSTVGNVLSKVAVFSTGRITNGVGSNTFSGSISLSGSNHFEIVSPSTLVLGGAITGSGNFNKASSGTLILTGTNTTTGMSRISTGTLRIGGGGISGSFAGTLSNSAALIFNRTADLTHSGVIVGPGTLQKLNTNVLTLAAANTYSGLTTISAGTLRIGNTSALGAVGTGATITSGGTLDVNGFGLGGKVITVAGAGAGAAGAIVNNGAPQTGALRTVTMTGNTTVGGSNRWDLRSGTLSSSGLAYTLTKTGPNTVGISSTTVDSGLGNVSIQQGVLSVEQGTTGLGHTSFTATIFSNAVLNLYALNTPLAKPITVQAGGKLAHSAPDSGGNNSTISSVVTLSGGDGFVENSSLSYSLLLNGSVAGIGNLVLTGSGLVQLNAANSYSGGTFITAGTLQLGAAASLGSTPVIAITNGAVFDVSAMGGGFVLGPTQTLSGNGTVLGSIIANGTVSPGASIGQLTISGNATLTGTTVMEVTKSGAVLASDVLNVSGTLTCGGNLVVSLTGDALVANDSFHLFAPGGFAGAFAGVTLPTLSDGLSWDTSTVATDGWIRVAGPASPVIGTVNVYGDEIVFGGSGGTPGATYYVLAASDVSLPLPQWAAIATNVFDTLGNFIFTNSIQSTNLQQFYQLQVP